ncbi:MAG: hypothetical protein AAFX78_08710 [Cyanobacteria bacterium J06638_20]
MDNKDCFSLRSFNQTIAPLKQWNCSVGRSSLWDMGTQEKSWKHTQCKHFKFHDGLSALGETLTPQPLTAVYASPFRSPQQPS